MKEKIRLVDKWVTNEGSFEFQKAEDKGKKGSAVLGAILGDIIGSPYEFDRGDKSKKFPLFIEKSRFTDDSVMSIAVADAFLKTSRDAGDEALKNAMIESMRYWGRKYPNSGYGARFSYWLMSENPTPYNSLGNGSAMRVSPAAWVGESLDEVKRFSKISAEVTHNHLEGIKGAQATACAIYLARTGSSKNEIKNYIEEEFGYNLGRTCDEIRVNYHHVETCMETVPEAITAFLEGEDFEDVIRTAVSLGGDCDTLTAISGSIAEGYYGVPAELKQEALDRLSPDLRQVVEAFQKEYLQ